MIYFVDNNGTVIDALTTPVNQGSVDTNNIYLIAPFASNLQFAVAFTLPNGLYTERHVMTPVGEIPNVQYAPTNAPYSIWSFTMPNDITQYYGTVYAQFYAYGTNGQITATSRTSFVVAAGVPEQLPSTPTQDVYNQILTALSQYSSQLNSGAYAARSIYWWIDTYTYGMNEITFYPVGTYGAFIKSLVTNNTGNQPYNSDGVLNSEYWAELANLNSIFDEAVNAQGSAAAAAASAQQAAQSASAASSSSSSAQQSATNAAASASSAAGSAQSALTSANNAAQSASAAASSAQSALTSASSAAGSATTAQNAAQELTDNLNKTAVFVDKLPSTGDSQYLYFVAGSDNNLFSIYTWDGAWQLLGSANLVVNNTKTYNLTLLSTAWSGNQQTLTVDGIADTDNVNIYPAEGYSDEYINYGIQAISASSSGVTFSCTSVPSENISVVVSVDTEVAIPTADGYATLAQLNTETTERESADNALQTDIDGIMEHLSQTQHFRGYYETTVQIQSLPNPQNGDYAWSAQTGTVWNYDGRWSNSGVSIPDQTVPKSTTTPLMDGTAALGSTNTYADGGHRHPTDTTRASAVDLTNETSAREAADTTLQNNINSEASARASSDTNLQNQIDDIVDGTTVVGAAESANSVTSKALSNVNIDDLSGENYWGKMFYAAGNSNVTGIPDDTDQSQGFALQILRGGGGVTVQLLIPDTNTDDGIYPSIWIRNMSGSWRAWQQFVTADGSYPTLGAGHLQEVQIVSNSANPAGWYKFAEIRSTNTGTYSIGASFYVDGVTLDNTENISERNTDGILNIEARCYSGVWSVAVSFVAGYLSSNNFVAVPVTGGVDVYVNLPTLWWAYKMTLLSKAVFSVIDYTVELTNTYYGTSAPSGAKYAVNKNYAAQVENALTIVTGTTAETYDGSQAVTVNLTSGAGVWITSAQIPTTAQNLTIDKSQTNITRDFVEGDLIISKAPKTLFNVGQVVFTDGDRCKVDFFANIAGGYAPDTGNAITVSTPTAGQTYTVPANGWLCISMQSTANGQYLGLKVVDSRGTDVWGAVNLTTSYFTGYPIAFYPVKQGDIVMFDYTVTVLRTQFIYATA